MPPLSPLVAVPLASGAGLIVGSFLATVVVRAGQGASALRGRSRCDGCGRGLGASELVPLLGWLARRGRCRTCAARIDPLHPAMELGAALVGGAALWVRPDLAGVAGAVFGWALLLLAMLDLRLFWLPDAVTLPLVPAGIAVAALAEPAPGARLAGALAGYILLEAVRRLYARARGREGMGGGDPKLLAAIGAWLGWRALPGVLLGASLLGLAVALAAAMRGREIGGATALPFGALLAPAAFAAWLVANLG